MFIRLGPKRNKKSSEPRGDGEGMPLAALVPNAITTLALCCGLGSIHFALKEMWPKAVGLIVLSAVFDTLDGGAARMLRVSSKFGAVLDSLSDFLAFGIAPALILHQWILKPTTGVELAAVMTFSVCSALRLARFTAAANAPVIAPVADAGSGAASSGSGSKSVDVKAKVSSFFTGMPTPAAAGAVTVPVMLMMCDEAEEWHVAEFFAKHQWIVVTYTFMIAILMISRVPMFSLKKLRISRAWAAPILVVLALLVVGMIRDPWLTLSGLAVFYLLLTPVAVTVSKRAKAA